MNYKLDGTKVIPCDNLIEWGEWFEKADRQVALTELEGVRVSTIFLGIDHSFGNGKPILFETMVFGKDKDGKCDYRDQECERYTTRDEAIKGHNKMVSRFMEKKLKASQEKKRK